MNTPPPPHEQNKQKQLKQKAHRRDQENLRRFKQALDAGTPFEELPGDLKRWWVLRY